MITSSIQKQLFQVTPIEQEQINNNGKNVQDVPTSPENIEDSIARMPFGTFLIKAELQLPNLIVFLIFRLININLSK